MIKTSSDKVNYKNNICTKIWIRQTVKRDVYKLKCDTFYEMEGVSY
jgi:hypothetical protein